MSEGSESRQNDGPTAAAEALDSAGAELDDMPDCDDAVIKVLTYQGRPKEGPHHPQLIGPWRYGQTTSPSHMLSGPLSLSCTVPCTTL